jgi:hypothetical protein
MQSNDLEKAALPPRKSWALRLISRSEENLRLNLVTER